MEIRDNAYRLKPDHGVPGVSDLGIDEEFSTAPPLSLYGIAKLCSEYLALEYGAAFGFPVWINRCGVLAGAGQFGTADQGIFSFWIHSHCARRPLRFIGFGGEGYQVRDCLHPRDLVPMLRKQLQVSEGKRITNLGGGPANAMSLRQLSDWCASRFGPHTVEHGEEERAFDVPWLILDSTQATEQWDWCPQTALFEILEEIAGHAETHPGWLDLSR
jgi:CDP-paratose 2-epimerase